MRIILVKDFESLGFEGDAMDVARGYARNYLIPKGIAVEATHSNLKALEMKKAKIMARRMKDKEDAETVKERISQVTLRVKQKAGAEGKLYGSVTTRDIAELLEEQGVEIDRRKIILEEPIRALGEFDVAIKIHPEVTANVKLLVEEEEEKA